MNAPDLEKLNEIADLVSEADLAKLAILRKKLSDLSERASTLANPPNADPLPGTCDPALRAGAGPRWERWRQDRLRDLQAERARLAAEVEAARQTAGRSFGRTLALSEILEEQRQAARPTPLSE